MTEDNQRVAIAKACGMKLFRMGPSDRQWLRPKPDGGVDQVALPDYTRNLNAMHGAEAHIPDTYDRYEQYLKSRLGDEWGYATAAQRAKAFLKTIGKWEESE